MVSGVLLVDDDREPVQAVHQLLPGDDSVSEPVGKQLLEMRSVARSSMRATSWMSETLEQPTSMSTRRTT